MADGGNLRADLMRAARTQQTLAQRQPARFVDRLIIGDRLLAARLIFAKDGDFLLFRLFLQI